VELSGFLQGSGHHHVNPGKTPQDGLVSLNYRANYFPEANDKCSGI